MKKKEHGCEGKNPKQSLTSAAVLTQMLFGDLDSHHIEQIKTTDISNNY